MLGGLPKLELRTGRVSSVASPSSTIIPEACRTGPSDVTIRAVNRAINCARLPAGDGLDSSTVSTVLIIAAPIAAGEVEKRVPSLRAMPAAQPLGKQLLGIIQSREVSLFLREEPGALATGKREQHRLCAPLSLAHIRLPVSHDH